MGRQQARSARPVRAGALPLGRSARVARAPGSRRPPSEGRRAGRVVQAPVRPVDGAGGGLARQQQASRAQAGEEGHSSSVHRGSRRSYIPRIELFSGRVAQSPEGSRLWTERQRSRLSRCGSLTAAVRQALSAGAAGASVGPQPSRAMAASGVRRLRPLGATPAKCVRGSREGSKDVLRWCPAAGDNGEVCQGVHGDCTPWSGARSRRWARKIAIDSWDQIGNVLQQGQCRDRTLAWSRPLRGLVAALVAALRYFLRWQRR